MIARDSRLLAARRTIAGRYMKGITSEYVAHPDAHPGVEHSFHLYVVRTPDPARLRRALEQRGIGTAVHYGVPVHRQPAYAGRLRCGPLAITERVADEILSLPLYPELSDGEVETVIAAVLHSQVTP